EMDAERKGDCLLFRPDVVKISLDSETALLLREAAPVPPRAGKPRSMPGQASHLWLECLSETGLENSVRTPLQQYSIAGCEHAKPVDLRSSLTAGGGDP